MSDQTEHVPATVPDAVPPSESGSQGAELLPVTLREATGVWCRVAILSFGGPAAQIAVMHRILVDEKKWISEERFLHALNYCMLLPGPEAQQLATYIGWLLHRTAGGLIAGTLFIFPGLVSILLLSMLYVTQHQAGWVQGLFYGLKPAVLAIVLEAVLRIGRRILINRPLKLLAAAAFISLFWLELPFPILVLTAGMIGYAGARWAPDSFTLSRSSPTGSSAAPLADRCASAAEVQPTWSRAARVSLICLTLWFGPLLACRFWLGSDSVFWHLGLFFSQAAMVTFGGAYAVLTYVGQAAVDRWHWLLPGEMLDGLAMAETTPGPLIMVVQFVGFLAGYRQPGPFSPLTGAILGALLTTWVTFVPCFFWIFLGAPYVERLRGNQRLAAALNAITAAVVGVILNLAVWFALHTLFAQVDVVRSYGIRWLIPDWTTADPTAIALAVLAAFLLLKLKRGLLLTLVLCGGLGAVLRMFMMPSG